MGNIISFGLFTGHQQGCGFDLVFAIGKVVDKELNGMWIIAFVSLNLESGGKSE